MKKLCASALIILLIASVSYAQVFRPAPLPQVPQVPGHRTETPAPIIVMPASPSSESIIIGPQGQITIIQQQGSDTFVNTID